MTYQCEICGKEKEFKNHLDAQANKWTKANTQRLTREHWICHECVIAYNEAFYNKENFEGEDVYEYA